MARSRSWFEITALAPTADAPATLEVTIRDTIGFGGVGEQEFITGLDEGGRVDRINLRLSSLGGNPFVALAIYNRLKRDTAEVYVFVESIAASAASIVAMAGDQVMMLPGSSLMIHRASTFVEGNITDMRAAVELLETTDENMAGIYQAKAGRGDLAAWLAAMEATTYFTAAKAVEAGLADEATDSDGEGIAPTRDPDNQEAGGGGPIQPPSRADLDLVDPLAAGLITAPPTDSAEFLARLAENEALAGVQHELPGLGIVLPFAREPQNPNPLAAAAAQMKEWS